MAQNSRTFKALTNDRYKSYEYFLSALLVCIEVDFALAMTQHV
jgi:hypothetical protein